MQQKHIHNQYTKRLNTPCRKNIISSKKSQRKKEIKSSKEKQTWDTGQFPKEEIQMANNMLKIFDSI